MTTKFSARLIAVAGVIASGFILANCNRNEAPEPDATVSAAPAPVVEPAKLPPAPAPVVTKAVILETATPNVADKAKAVLAQGTDVDSAIRGFHSPQEFLAVAYASKNLGVPFVLLKDRVLTQKMTLARAITATSKNTVNATLEAQRAELEARADLARKSGPQ